MAQCECRCHAYGGSQVTCDRGPVQPGGEKSCTWLHDNDGQPLVVRSGRPRCGVCDAETNARLCRVCLERLERDIGDMTSLLHEVSLVATGQARVYRAAKRVEIDDEIVELDEEYQHRMAAIPARLRSRDGRMALPSTALPVNLEARELLYDAYDTLAAWCGSLGALEIKSSELVAFLLTNVQDIRYLEDAAQCYDEITYLHSRLEGTVDRSPERIYAGPCHADRDGVRCERDLYAPPGRRDDDDAVIVCDGHRGDEEGCGATHLAGDRKEWLLASLEDSLVPLDELRAFVKSTLHMPWPPGGTVRSWVNRKQIQPHTVVHGVELYRGGDVLDKVREWATTRRTA